ncbi:MAG: HlyD family efflux transporter periplasmic adaptor subunit [Thermoguttaceae bacterium]|nr:HlyD family efflux transporter periplasmic adaptor subunit [Thermoguttaceae bacterium]MBR4752790.1 HlyD family efflux transporter periplasmic adaptor subunit [Thermoguttaceae bacterium]
MSSEQRYDANMLEHTKQQIRVLVNEIAQVSRSDVAPDVFQAEFLTRVVRALGAIGGAMWMTDESGRLTLGYQVNLKEAKLHEDDEANKVHSYLLYNTLRSSENDLMIPPHSGGEGANDGGNPTDFLLILGVVQTELEKVGVIEVFQRPDSNPATQQGYLQFVRQVTRYATEYYKNRQLKNFSDRQSLWTRLEDFTRNIHKTLDLRETLYTVANEGRRLIECDRVSLAVMRGGRAKIEAVSGQDMVDKRSETVKLLGDLATAVVKANEPMVYNGDSANLAPQVEAAVEEYVDASHTKTIAVYPLVAHTIDEKDYDETERDKLTIPPPFGAIVVEQIEDSNVSEHMMKRVEIVVEHARVAVGNAIDHNSIFLAPLWQAIGKSKVLTTARMLPKTIAVALGVLALILAMIFVPWNFNMHCDGSLEPVARRNVFAREAGKVDTLLVEHGQQVKKGDVLLVLSNNELEAERQKNDGELNEVEKQILALKEQSYDAKDAERIRINGQLAQYTERKQTLSIQRQILNARNDDLTVRAPIDGTVMTFQLENTLKSRPVQPGQILMEIAQPDGELQLELQMPEKYMGHIEDYKRKIQEQDANAPLKVKFVMTVDPSNSHDATVTEVHDRAENRGAEETTVEILASIDDKSDLPEAASAGMGVSAKIYCGKRALGYVCFNELVAFLQRTVFFWFQ